MTVAGTVATLVAATLLQQQSEQAELGLVRIDTPAGLYVTNIRLQSHIGESFRDARAAIVSLGGTDLRVVTTPMQKPMLLPAGNYQVRLEGVAQVAQTVDVVVNARESTEIEYIDRRESL